MRYSTKKQWERHSHAFPLDLTIEALVVHKVSVATCLATYTAAN